MKTSADKPSLAGLFLSFLRLGLTAFGGPAMVAHIREMSVTRHKWLDEDTFKDGVALCQSIPGATAMQTAAYVGFRSNGIPGALASFVGFGLPAFILMLILSSLYAKYYTASRIVSLFNGLQVIVVAIVANATYSFGKSTFRSYSDVLIAVAAGALFWAGVSPFIVIMGTACAGALFLKKSDAASAPVHAEGMGSRAFKQIGAFFMIVLSCYFALYLYDPKFFRFAALLMRIDMFAFGGGFASIPLMLHEVVDVRGWMDSKTFMDGIALGQVTPGPIVITSTFVGYMLYGFSGAMVATAAIFTPSFLMVIFITPIFDRLKASAYFIGATKGILASFVGLLFFVSLKFTLAVPWDTIRALIGIAAFTSLFKKIDILYVVLVMSVLSVFIFRQ
jgi:chromate transporter